ncbi:hypothetical protein D3C72_1845420 [compost metagenome]
MTEAAQTGAGARAAVAAAAEKHQRALRLLQPRGHLSRQAAQRYAAHLAAFKHRAGARRVFIRFAHVDEDGVGMLAQEGRQGGRIELEFGSRHATVQHRAHGSANAAVVA